MEFGDLRFCDSIGLIERTDFVEYIKAIILIDLVLAIDKLSTVLFVSSHPHYLDLAVRGALKEDFSHFDCDTAIDFLLELSS
jgi:hypothetical protein